LYKRKLQYNFGEEATSAFAGFLVGPPSWANWNFEMLFFVKEGKPENTEKHPQG